MDVAFDSKGDLDRESFMIEVKNGQQVVVATLPPLGGPIGDTVVKSAKPAKK
jgi:branched-chain amino acid transport system substrate-binding protein